MNGLRDESQLEDYCASALIRAQLHARAKGYIRSAPPSWGLEETRPGLSCLALFLSLLDFIASCNSSKSIDIVYLLFRIELYGYQYSQYNPHDKPIIHKCHLSSEL